MKKIYFLAIGLGVALTSIIVVENHAQTDTTPTTVAPTPTTPTQGAPSKVTPAKVATKDGSQNVANLETILSSVQGSQAAHTTPNMTPVTPNTTHKTTANTTATPSPAAEAGFNTLFPEIGNAQMGCDANGKQLYSLTGLESAMKFFPQFLSNSDESVNRRELAAFFANIAHETSGSAPGQYNGGLCFTHEQGCTNQNCTQYCCSDPNVPNCAKYPCTAGKGYYGRGPLQLSYNYNYGAARDGIRAVDPSFPDILADPDQVQSASVVAWETALWFWMTAQSPKPSCHQAIIATPGTAVNGKFAGFGLTIDIINGGIECGPSASPQGQQEMQNRIDYYKNWFGPKLGLTSADYANDSCANLPPYSGISSPPTQQQTPSPTQRSSR